MVIVLGLCDVLLLRFAHEKNDNQEVLLDGDCVGYLLGVVLCVSIGISLGKPDGDKVGYSLVIVLETVLNT